MAKPEWGVKRICSACGTKYYDFNNSPIICPSCKTEFDPDVYLKSRKGKSFSPKVVTENNDDIQNFMKQVNPLLEKFMDENSYSILLDGKNVIIGKKSNNLTNEILKIVDNNIK